MKASATEKYIILHGHFYQPPRENAWLEEIEIQESADPWHDWNARITDECYRPNAVSRILNDRGRIVDISNNYAKMSFNFGPTLLSWMETYAPKVYQSILEADKLSQEHFGGHGSAMAQVYNHIIMPLANRRDKETQIIWGLHDFKRRFGRPAEGMWLAETAVDLETLEILQENGVKFTLLAPNQAKSFRKIGAKEWQEGVETHRAYRCNLPNGESIALFFYDGQISQDVAFSGLLNNGKRFAEALRGSFDQQKKETQLVHIATDGETYGHHHRHGDMALAYCLHQIEVDNEVQLTNYSEFLAENEITHEVEIHENSSWSCAHGVDRWRDDCGCSSGMNPLWRQQWRGPLREGLNWLRDQLADIFEREMVRFHTDPWALRNLYIEVPLKRSIRKAEAFIAENIPGSWNSQDKSTIMQLLEMQRNGLYMFTSCGWFFDEISGIETVQILQYANRAIQLAEKITGRHLETGFLDFLKRAESNLDDLDNGRQIYEQMVAPSRLNLTKVGMHYAVASIFADRHDKLEVLNYECESEEFDRRNAGSHKLSYGRTRVKSKITLSEEEFSFVILYLGHHHVIGHTFDDLSKEEFLHFVERLKGTFESSNLSEVIELMKVYPKQRSFSFFDMFKDEQIKLLRGILDEQIALANSSYKKINDRNYNLMNVMRTQRLHLPGVLIKNLELVLNHDLTQILEADAHRISIRRLKNRVEELQKWDLTIDTEKFSFRATQKLNRLAERLANGDEEDAEKVLANIREALRWMGMLDLKPELSEVQNVVFRRMRQLSEKEFPHSEPYQEALIELARLIFLEVPEEWIWERV